MTKTVKGRKNPLIPSMIPIGKRLAEAREKKGWTQERLAEKLGTSAQDLGQIEQGWRAASVPKLHAVARKLKVDPDWLLTGVDPNLAEAFKHLLETAEQQPKAKRKTG